MQKIIKKMPIKIKYGWLVLVCGLFAVGTPSFCYALNGGSFEYGTENGRLLLAVPEEGMTVSADEVSDGKDSAETAAVDFFDPEVMAKVRAIISSNDGDKLSAESVAALRALGLDAATINGIAAMTEAHPGTAQNLSAAVWGEMLQQEEDGFGWFFGAVLMFFLAAIVVLIYIIVRKSSGS